MRFGNYLKKWCCSYATDKPIDEVQSSEGRYASTYFIWYRGKHSPDFHLPSLDSVRIPL